MVDATRFQYCQKIVLLRHNDSEILLAQRKGEADYDGIYSLIGGKMETTDNDLLDGLRREKREEIGQMAEVSVCPFLSYNAYFVKKDGNAMVLPHYYAVYSGGDIILNEEYSAYAWVKITDLESFEPKIANIPEVVTWALKLKTILEPKHFFLI